MNARFLTLTAKATHELKLTMFNFLDKNLEEKEVIGDVFNLIISSFMSAMGRSLYDTAKASDDLKNKDKIDYFMKKLELTLSEMGEINKGFSNEKY